MVAVPFLISVLSLAYSVVPPDVIPLFRIGGVERDARQSSMNQQPGSRNFFSGVVFGVGLSTLISYELRRRRILERVRVAFFSWLYDNEEGKLVERYRKPVKVLELEGEKIVQSANEDGSMGLRSELLSPDWALTSRFNVAMLTLGSGTELLPKKTENVEFYYVIKGDGNFVSGEQKEQISAGAAFIVDPGRERGFSVRGRNELVLLRATDAATSESDETRFHASTLSSTVSTVKAALEKVGTLISTYSGKSDSNLAAE